MKSSQLQFHFYCSFTFQPITVNLSQPTPPKHWGKQQMMASKPEQVDVFGVPSSVRSSSPTHHSCSWVQDNYNVSFSMSTHLSQGLSLEDPLNQHSTPSIFTIPPVYSFPDIAGLSPGLSSIHLGVLPFTILPTSPKLCLYAGTSTCTKTSLTAASQISLALMCCHIFPFSFFFASFVQHLLIL